MYLRKNLFEKLKTPLRIQSRSTGYIVLVPEIGENEPQLDPLVKVGNGLPSFNSLTVENCLVAIRKHATNFEQTIRDIENKLTKGENLNIPVDILKSVEQVSNPLETTWGVAKSLYYGNSSLMPSKHYINIHNCARSARALKFTSISIFNKINDYVAISMNDKNIDDEEKRVLNKYILEGHLNGLHLDNNKQESLKEVINRLTKERAIFKSKVDVATRNFSHTISDYSVMRDFPEEYLGMVAVDSSAPRKGPWKISLEKRIVDDFLKYCPDRDQRWNIWQANVKRASGLTDKNLANSTHLEIIRSYRKQQAELLGFKNFAAMSMETKMNKSVNNIVRLFSKLQESAGPAQNSELEKLQNFAVQSGFEYNLKPWDIDYWERKQLRGEFKFEEELLKEYFPLPNVLDGLIKLIENIFSVKFVKNKETVETWNPSVIYYDIYDNSSLNGDPIAGIYLDCFLCDKHPELEAQQQQQHKRYISDSIGWMIGIRNRNVTANATPLAALIFKFRPSKLSSEKSPMPYLLSVDELQALFKNFGLALQHLLTKANYSDLAGLSNVEWDASQICGHVLVNFLDNPKVIESISSHYKSNDKIPLTLAQQIKMKRNHMAGHKLCKELYLSHLDLELYSNDDFWLDIVKRTWPIYMQMPLEKSDSHPCSMLDIFSGDWSAAYFSHLYSKILAADVYSAFHEEIENESEDFINKNVGKRFRDTFLSYGGSKSTAEIFRIFRGRDPTPEAFLKSINYFQTNDSPTSMNF